MPFNPETFTTDEQVFNDEAFDIIGTMEQSIGQFNEGVHNDGVGVPTIGYGYAMLDRNGNDEWIIKPNLDTDLAEIGLTLSIEADDLLGTIAANLNQNNSAANADLIEDLDALIDDITEDEARELFDLEWERALDLVNARFRTHLGTQAGDALFERLGNTHELLVLGSLAFNGGSNLIGHGVTNAMNDGNRAEAWYEIRYNSNANQLGGLAKRRYYESQIFGLYDAAPAAETPEEQAERLENQAFEVYRMYTRHRQDILEYERQYGEGSTNNRIDDANTDYALVGDERVQTLQESFQPAYDYLIANYVTDLNAGITIDYRDIQIGSGGVDILNGTQRAEFQLGQGEEQSDLILGEGGNDSLSGGGVSDILYGGEGDDTLYGGNYADTEDGAVDYLLGGDGFDVYHVGNGDIINDADSEGRVFYDGAVLVPGLHGSEQDENQYVSLDGRFTYTLNGTDLTVTVNDSDPPVSFTIQNFSSGSLGIVLRDKPDISYTSPYRVTQDQADGASIVENDNNPNTVDYSPTGNDAIIGTAGETFIRVDPLTQGAVIYGDGSAGSAEQGGDFIDLDNARDGEGVVPAPTEGTTVLGQGGDDLVHASLDHDWVEGNAGHDVLYGSYGDDVLIGGQDNDYLQGDTGDDVVIGSNLAGDTGPNDSNHLSGGEGDDTVLGADGSDFLYGDAFTWQMYTDLTLIADDPPETLWRGETFPDGIRFTLPADPNGDLPVIGSPSPYPVFSFYKDPLEGSGDDHIDGGAGNDRAYGGAEIQTSIEVYEYWSIEEYRIQESEFRRAA